MRILFAMLMGLVLLGHDTYNWFRVTHYAWEYELYAKVLCENKDRPELRCNGVCHLKRELAEAPASESPALPEIESEICWLWFNPESPFQMVGHVCSSETLGIPMAPDALRSGWKRRLERPPGEGLHIV